MVRYDDERPDPDQLSQRLSDDDRSHLKLLEIFHYVLAALSAFGGVITMAMFIVMRQAILDPDGQFSNMPMSEQDRAAREQFLRMIDETFGREPFENMVTALLILVGAFILMHVFFTALVGFCIRIRKMRVAIIIFEVMNLFSFPFGTALAIGTLIVLFRPQVKEAFDPPATQRRSDAWDDVNRRPDRLP